MNAAYDYRKFALMYVDDEPQTVSNFEAYFSDTFDVVVTTSGEEAWEIFSKDMDRFAIVMTDQRMPQSTGVELLEKIKLARPRVLRILATAYSDLDAAIAAVNSGSIYKYVTKPWDPPFIEILLKRGMEFFLVQRELDSLLKEKMAAMQRLMTTDRLLSLGIFAAGLNHHLQELPHRGQNFPRPRPLPASSRERRHRTPSQSRLLDGLLCNGPVTDG